ncbi:MAG TPA: YggS family pyridoxal phosphate-dependent enzyme [Ilumatobacteraceae bacterium]|nr:YggS family pyridoxal phosphate-dependent enzyme [Ilumatobacteraceae bacterium]
MIDAGLVRERLATVEARITAAGGTGVAVLAVTKGFGAEAIDAAVAAGCRQIGENYAKELLEKLRLVGATTARPEIHFIGRLQSNKVRSLSGVVDVYESVDRTSLVDAIARRDHGARVLVQVDTTGDPGKGGCPAADVESLVGAAVEAGLRVEGLMTVGPTEGGPEASRRGFREVRRLTTELGLGVCSMGMTDDLEVAVEEGSTQVRVGTALFGWRDAR